MDTKRKPTVIYLENEAFCIRVPTNQEWSMICAQAQAPLHWEYIWSWCQDPILNEQSRDTDPLAKSLSRALITPAHRIIRGCSALHASSAARSDSKGPHIDFRPVFVPIDPETLEPDANQWADTEDGSILSFGTLYMNNEPLAFPRDPTDTDAISNYVAGASLHIAHSEPDPTYQIQVIKYGDIFVADRNLIKNISWNELDRCGLIYGDKTRAKPQTQPQSPFPVNTLKEKIPFLKKQTSKNDSQT